MKTIDITTAKTAELVSFFNANCRKIGREPVKKFASRAAAIERITALMEAIEPMPPETNQTRSASIADSWARSEVKTARSARHAVSVGGVTYASVAKAFAALGLPANKIVRLRGQLVKTGAATLDGYDFKLVRA